MVSRQVFPQPQVCVDDVTGESVDALQWSARACILRPGELPDIVVEEVGFETREAAYGWLIKQRISKPRQAMAEERRVKTVQ